MPTDQVQLVVSAVKAAPLDYVVPNVAEIEPLSVYAEYDGSGAAGSYVPTIQIISDAGRVVANSQIGTTLAAGASADVSWFPHVGGGTSGGSSTGGQEMWPTYYDIPLDSAAALDDYNGALSGGWRWIIDNTYERNGYWHPQAPAVNKHYEFKLNLGPAYSTWSHTCRLATGPTFGIATVRLLKLAEFDDQRPAGYWSNTAGLTSDYIFGSGVFSSPIDTIDCYSAVLTKHVDTLGLTFRIGGSPGTDAMTTPTLANDSDGFKTVSTGPGLYQVQVIVDSKNGASSDYDFRVSVQTFNRVDGHSSS